MTAPQTGGKGEVCNPTLDVFCMLALDCGLLAIQDWAILREVCTHTVGPDEIGELIMGCGLTNDHGKVRELMRIATEHVVKQEALVRDARSRAPRREVWKTSLDVEWFAFLAVSREVVPKETILSLAAHMDNVEDPLTFAQELIDSGVSDNLSAIQGLLDIAQENAATGKPPPLSVFD